MSELSGMNCQGLPSNWNWDTAENVHCSSGTVHIIIDILILTLNLLTTTIVAPPSSASKWQMGFNSAFKGLNMQRF